MRDSIWHFMFDCLQTQNTHTDTHNHKDDLTVQQSSFPEAFVTVMQVFRGILTAVHPHPHLCSPTQMIIKTRMDAFRVRISEPRNMLQKQRSVSWQNYPTFAVIFVLAHSTSAFWHVLTQLTRSSMSFRSGNGPGCPVLGGVCCQAPSEVKLENTDKTNWRHSTDISQQCSYLLQARFSPKAGLPRNWVQMKAEF